MILIIDSTNPDQLFLSLCKDNGDGSICFDKIIAKRNAQLEIILPQIDNLLKSQHVQKCDLNAIVVNEGPGTYTGLRIGITTANALAWSLNIPIYSFCGEASNEIACMMEKKLSMNEKFSSPISPKYPNIL